MSAAVVRSRSDSLMRSRAAFSIRVSPAQSAASTLTTGTRSGTGPASSVMPRSVPRRTVTVSPSMFTSAPKRVRISVMARSACRDAGSNPDTQTPCRDSAPMHRKNAAFDQSPSTSCRPGAAYRCPPGIVQHWPFFSKRIPAARSACSVMATYRADCSCPVTVSTLSSASSGSANRSPDTNCDETLPGRA